ncbi:DUF4160 domain-containing protein [Aureimonas leprariae]|uniref:DUF4160 domain-containing protein n=1 Tax=Plantimonas leprariae TaxID=2615207 RepID=A0A7V7PPL1_9HYPH|nr:DUF4160 domain-containing protein [Aureimonas leprariae]KAB0679983.1 DUF4160 domain-containing protein [Aureimonas leprariae]
MPRVFVWKGWEFLFYSLDGSEPPHIHARSGRKELKIWLDSLKVARNSRCRPHEVGELLAVVSERRREFLERWHEHFGN